MPQSASVPASRAPFHRSGFDVAISYRSSVTAAQALVDELNAIRAGSASCWHAEMTDNASVSKLGNDVLAHHKRLDVLINNASSFYPTAYGESTQAQWDDLVGSNLRGAYFLTQQLSAELAANSGAVVNLTDTHADRALPKHPIYSIAKAGLKAMTKITCRRTCAPRASERRLTRRDSMAPVSRRRHRSRR